tara:strand:- start:1471 stop:2055 length:585 start_codon:yes stop_codon:yes gene_type:complete
MQIQSSAIIEKFFVDSDLPDEGYNNQDFYMGSANRMRYILATLDMSPGDPYSDDHQLKLGQEDNRFYGCIEFFDNGFSVKNDSLLKELIAMTEQELTNYIETNEYEWLGDDYDHIHQYLNFVSAWQDEWQFWGEDMDNDECMTIVRERWITDRKAGVKSTNPYEVAYNILAEYWDHLPEDEKEEINARLEPLGL